jgi:hypothetical protein
MSFYVKTDESDFTDSMVSFLKKQGYVQKHTVPVDFLFLSGEASYYSKKIDTRRSSWLSLLYGKSVQRLCDKESLHTEYSRVRYILPTKIIRSTDEFPRVKFDSPKILKPTKGWKGSGIGIVTTKEDAMKWISDHKQYDTWLLQNYIVNPALKDGYKFHLRVLVLVKKPHNSAREVYIATHKFYVKAVSKYKEDDWLNPDIHDTHYKPSKLETFPTDKPDNWSNENTSTADIKVNTIIKKLLMHEEEFHPVWNSKNGFEVFGADVMFDEHTPYLLEFNNKMSLKGRSSYAPGIVSTILFNKSEPYFTRIL